MIPPVAARLPDGRRLHLQHGPIDLIIEVTGTPDVIKTAETAAIVRFESVLPELVAQLPSLRAEIGRCEAPVGTVAERMVSASTLFVGRFRSPMIAVAGSVADEICSVIAATSGVRRAYVNNGGDVALYLAADGCLTMGLVPDPETGRPHFSLELTAASPARGLATSGRGGRSFSLGIADAVTVLADLTAIADAAATLIANAVDLPGHPAIMRAPATSLDPDSDLGSREVTTSVGTLTDDEVGAALDRGVVEAEHWLSTVPQIHGVVLSLQGTHRPVGLATADLVTTSSNARSDRAVANV